MRGAPGRLERCCLEICLRPAGGDLVRLRRLRPQEGWVSQMGHNATGRLPIGQLASIQATGLSPLGWQQSVRGQPALHNRLSSHVLLPVVPYPIVASPADGYDVPAGSAINSKALMQSRPAL